MTDDNPTSAREDATALAMEIGVHRAALAVHGAASETLDNAAARANDLILRAGAAEQTAMLASMERLDPDQFARRVRLRRRKDALTKRDTKPLTASAGSACGPCRCDGTAEKFSVAHVSREVEAKRVADRAEWYAKNPGVTDAHEVLKRFEKPAR